MAEFTGRRVKIVLENGTDYEGFVHSMDSSVGKLSLEKVTIPSSGKIFQGLKHFFRDDLVSVDVLEEQIKPKKVDNDTLVPDRRELGPRMMYKKCTPQHLGRLQVFQPAEKMLIRMSSQEDKKSESHPGKKSESKSSDYDSSSDQDIGPSDDNCVVIDNVDDAFCKAMREIYSHKVIGIAVEGVCIGRSGTLCWLNVVLQKQIFLFDVMTMGKDCFEKGLKDLLEDGDILKVMHDCRLPSDLLFHQFDVKLCNMFDTQVSDAFVYRLFHNGDWPRYVHSLQACLFDHLNLPQEQIQLMKVRAAMKKEDQAVWMERPLNRQLLDAACKNVMHLLDLRLVLVEKMMVQFVAGVDVFLSYSRDANAEEAKKHQSCSYLLPVAFRDLDRMTRNYRDYWRGNDRTRPVNRDENGFYENCSGLADPDVFHSRDSIWHTGWSDKQTRGRGTIYLNKFEHLMKSNESENKMTPPVEQTKKANAPGPILPSTSSTEATGSSSDGESVNTVVNSVPDADNPVDSVNRVVNSTPDPHNTNSSCLEKAPSSNSQKQSTGMLIRSFLQSQNGYVSECDSLESFSLRPAGVYEGNIGRKKRHKEIPEHAYYAGPPGWEEKSKTVNNSSAPTQKSSAEAHGSVNVDDASPRSDVSSSPSLNRTSSSSPNIQINLAQPSEPCHPALEHVDEPSSPQSPSYHNHGHTSPVFSSNPTTTITYQGTQHGRHSGQLSPKSPQTASPESSGTISPVKSLQNCLNSTTSRLEKLQLMCNVLKKANS